MLCIGKSLFLGVIWGYQLFFLSDPQGVFGVGFYFLPKLSVLQNNYTFEVGARARNTGVFVRGACEWESKTLVKPVSSYSKARMLLHITALLIDWHWLMTVWNAKIPTSHGVSSIPSILGQYKSKLNTGGASGFGGGGVGAMVVVWWRWLEIVVKYC